MPLVDTVVKILRGERGLSGHALLERSGAVFHQMVTRAADSNPCEPTKVIARMIRCLHPPLQGKAIASVLETRRALSECSRGQALRLFRGA
jgi:hypothetical protein